MRRAAGGGAGGTSDFGRYVNLPRLACLLGPPSAHEARALHRRRCARRGLTRRASRRPGRADAPLWHQFFACAYCSWPDVERKPSRARERFDADQCREHFRVPRQNATRRRASEGRKAQLARERAEFERLFRDGQARGVPDAYEYARQKLGKTAREVAKLWKGVAPQGSSTGLRGGAGLAIALTPSWLLRYA